MRTNDWFNAYDRAKLGEACRLVVGPRWLFLCPGTAQERPQQLKRTRRLIANYHRERRKRDASEASALTGAGS